MNSGPVAQLRPTESSGACIDRGVERLDVLAGEHRPHRLDRGRDHDRARAGRPRRRPASIADAAPALTLRVSCDVSRRRKSAPPSTRPERLRLGSAPISSSKVTPPVTVIALVVGPIEPATKRGRPGVEAFAAASRASSAARRLISMRLSREAVLGEHERRAAERVGLDHVGAGVEVAPRGCRGTTSGRVRTRFSLQPSRSGPPKSSAVRSWPWIAVPIAPSRTRIRSGEELEELPSARRITGEGMLHRFAASLHDAASRSLPGGRRTMPGPASILGARGKTEYAPRGPTHNGDGRTRCVFGLAAARCTSSGLDWSAISGTPGRTGTGRSGPRGRLGGQNLAYRKGIIDQADRESLA